MVVVMVVVWSCVHRLVSGDDDGGSVGGHVSIGQSVVVVMVVVWSYVHRLVSGGGDGDGGGVVMCP